MDEQKKRYSDLAPFSIGERIWLSIEACHFFSANNNKEMSEFLAKPKQSGSIIPLEGGDFIDYLEKSKKLESANQRMFRIVELLKSLAAANILIDMGPGRGVIRGNKYYFMKEFTNKQGSGICWLAPALGAEFIYFIFGSAVVHITGTDLNDDAVAGTGIVLNEHWILTCAHVLDDMKLDNDQNFGGSVNKVVEKHSHDQIDVGLIKVENKMSPVKGLSFSPPVAGSNLYTIGYPRVPMSKSPHPIIHKGEVTVPMVQTFHGSNLFLYSAIARPGNSGGPIICEDGTVLGIVTQELFEPTSTAGLPFYAGVPTDEIDRAIKEICPEVKLPIESYE